MMPSARFLLGCLLKVSALADGGAACDSAAVLSNWPQWRGPLANGIAPRANPRLWECAGLTDNVVSSPVHTDGVVIAGNSYYQQAMLAIRLAGAKGDITGTDRVAWKLNRMTPYVSSPLRYGDKLYFLRHNQNI